MPGSLRNCVNKELLSSNSDSAPNGSNGAMLNGNKANTSSASNGNLNNGVGVVSRNGAGGSPPNMQSQQQQQQMNPSAAMAAAAAAAAAANPLSAASLLQSAAAASSSNNPNAQLLAHLSCRPKIYFSTFFLIYKVFILIFLRLKFIKILEFFIFSNEFLYLGSDKKAPRKMK